MINGNLNVVRYPCYVESNFFQDYFEEVLLSRKRIVVNFEFKCLVTVEHIHKGRVKIIKPIKWLHKDLRSSVSLWVYYLWQPIDQGLVNFQEKGGLWNVFEDRLTVHLDLNLQPNVKEPFVNIAVANSQLI